MADLFQSYIEELPQLAPFFSARPFELFAHEFSAPSHDHELVEVINSYQEMIGGRGSLAPDDIVIVTGQQPGLFTGPLYTVYKAITAIRLAQTISQRLGVRCTPVFWNASHDHDIEESGIAHFLTKRREVLSIEYPDRQSVRGMPMYRVPLPESLHDCVRVAAEETNGWEFKDEIVGFLHQTLKESRSLAEWFARLMARLFRETPLVIFDPTLPVVREKVVTLFEKEIANPTVLSRIVMEAGDKLRRLGFSAQIKKAEKECSFFLERNGFRRKVIFEKDEFYLPEDAERVSLATMKEWLDKSPESFSENVVLRPIAQQVLLHPVAYVAGPGEIAYWAQLRDVFRWHGVDMPIVYPRARCVLMTTKEKQILERYGLTLSDLEKPLETLTELVIAKQNPSGDLNAFKTQRDRLEDTLEQFQRNIQNMKGKIPEMTRVFVAQVRQGLDRLEKAVLRGDRDVLQTVENQIRRLCAVMWPMKKPQERVYTVFSFLFEHGWELIPRLIHEIDERRFTVHEVEL
ncbi:MAG TPA: bacillithiol biosynthesis cysteine-adding enzyme BshC [Candidatus Hydrogenedentes bacterium]|nr:bacillithiol biosynthesis cysteine-adding enzyme BshC [Candidatus Hydrogenedentota bacterium]HOL77521.1 bacillithiol biosynthesis cysteine-adding enzyme BshC [Candidatus Hydrogenedentota bacterium]HPO86600.1 bacillithiol biosynthesis cysteine-adding enzyme BshC [Candidatus Hydrogenedentota bacterium]